MKLTTKNIKMQRVPGSILVDSSKTVDYKYAWTGDGINVHFEKWFNAVINQKPSVEHFAPAYGSGGFGCAAGYPSTVNRQITYSNGRPSAQRVRNTGPRPLKVRHTFAAVPPLCQGQSPVLGEEMGALPRMANHALLLFDYEDYVEQLTALFDAVRVIADNLRINNAPVAFPPNTPRINADNADTQIMLRMRKSGKDAINYMILCTTAADVGGDRRAAAVAQLENYYTRFHRALKANALYADCAMAVARKSNHAVSTDRELFRAILGQLATLCPNLIGIGSENEDAAYTGVRVNPSNAMLEMLVAGLAPGIPTAEDAVRKKAMGVLRDLPTNGLKTTLAIMGKVDSAAAQNVPGMDDFEAILYM